MFDCYDNSSRLVSWEVDKRRVVPVEKMQIIMEDTKWVVGGRD